MTDHLTVIGISGTQHGCTEPQLVTLRHTLTHYRLADAVQLHHGDCIGVDDQAHGIATELGYWRGVHPPIDQRRACGHLGDFRYDPKPFLIRNGDIVDVSDLMIIVPATFHEQLRSGTWSTYRRAKRHGVPIVIIWPDGTMAVVEPGGVLTAVQ